MFRWPVARNRVERKLVLVVLLCACLPMMLISLLALREIKSQTLIVAEQQLRDMTKTYALTLLERLDYAARELVIMDLGFADVVPGMLVRSTSHGDTVSAAARPALTLVDQGVRLGLPEEDDLLLGEISFEELFQDLGHVPFGVRRCVEINGANVGCSGEPIEGDALRVQWELPLASVYETDFRLNVVSFQQQEAALRHVSLVSEVLPLAIVFVAVVLAWLLVSLIRRHIAPLSELHDATRLIQEGRYDTRVQIHTGDEFERLGTAFNTMTARMGRAFDKMQSLAEIDRLILSGARLEDVIEQALLLAGEHYGCSCYVYLWREHHKQGRLYEVTGGRLSSRELCLLPDSGADRSAVDVTDALARVLGEALTTNFPIRTESEPSGAILAGQAAEGLETRWGTLAELADRISVAATNTARANALYRQANYDALTGLINRQAFSDRLAEAIRSADRRGVRGALLFLDLDRFKQVNDTEGHTAGDRLLSVVARRLQATVRASDTVGRLGGDEFALVMPEVESERELANACRRLIQEINEPIVVERLRHEVDVSIGVSLFPDDGLEPGSLLMKADVAMYQAKSQGGSTFAFFDQSLNALTERRVRIESGLRSALAEGALKLYYQPKMDLASGRITSLEGLLRWEGQQDGDYGPADFVPVAEETGLIHQFTDLLILEAGCCMQRCRARGVPVESIALNISSRQFSKEGFVNTFLAALSRNGLSASEIEIEITESLFIADADSVSRDLMRLRAAGVRIALDDFGTGYSSLNLLRSLPLNTVKIDRSFITPLMGSPMARVFAQKIIEMASVLKLVVVAEGVEDWQEVELLESLGCHFVQGYVLSRALPLEEVITLVDGFRWPDRMPPAVSAESG